MKNLYYDLPISFSDLKKKNKELSLCNYEKSIAQNIFMLITSRPGEHRFDYELGCEIWESDFELISNQNTWKEKIRKSVEQIVLKKEKRLKQIYVDAELSEEEIISPITNKKSIKKRLKLRVRGVSVLTGEDFLFETKLFISPISMD